MKGSISFAVAPLALIAVLAALLSSIAHSLSLERPPTALSRRTLLVAIPPAVAATSLFPRPSSAKVFYDPDRYGDKELKIALVNRIRQNVRDLISSSPSLAESFLRLSLADSLSYSEATEFGGGDGCIIQWTVNNKCDPMYKEAADALIQLQAKLKKTNEVTLGDVLSLAGAEALESVGGPRSRVQIGKLPPKKCSATDYTALLPPASAEYSVEAVNIFKGAGLTEREVAVVAGLVGDIRTITQSAAANIKVEEKYVNEMGETDFIPDFTFGSAKDIYGKTVGSRPVGNQYLKEYFSKKRSVKGTIWEDDNTLSWGLKYATANSRQFSNDCKDGVEKIFSRGVFYTGGKVEALTGKGFALE